MKLPEVWLRGPIDGVPALLMPAAHALVQAREDVTAAAAGLTPEELWRRPGGAASIGFHIRHMGGSLARLCTYARGRPLSPAQLSAIAGEGEPGTPPLAAEEVLRGLDDAIEEGLRTLRETPEGDLLTPRFVGRRQLPSNVLGLLFHAAEHTQRHTGQVIVTAKMVKGAALPGD